ncbi:organic cation transporter protein-like [Anticarsia gemmatalis]|uniref:organic cation transporter protein-like n=1 Tax=Anticarsia gemmatalis TaxID=129554 RepID=UPI003F761A51
MGADVKEIVRPKIDIDAILVNEAGQFGKFQVRMYLLVLVAVLFHTWASVEYVFTTTRMKTRCLIPECDNDQPEWSPDWIYNAIPPTAPTNNCYRFANTSTVLDSSDTCPSGLFDTTTLLPCEEYVYENTNTVVYDFGLACDEWRRSLIGVLRTAGTLVALPITGYISDRWGRRVALVFNCFNTAWLGFTRYWAQTYIGFVLSEFIEAVFGSGIFSCCYILMMESVGPKYRVAAGASMNTFFALGEITMGFLAWCVPDWRQLTLTIYAPQIITLTYYFIISESVRWYVSKGRYKETEELLKKIAKVNGKELSEKTMEQLRDAKLYKDENVKSTETEIKAADEPCLILLVFRHKRVLLRCIVSPIWWITTTFTFYGLSINAVNMSGNRYVNYIAVAFMEIPGYWLAVFLMGKIGRKPVLVAGFWICAACQMAYVFMPKGMYTVSLVVYLVAKFCIAMVIVTVYVYTVELYPTRYRHRLFAFSSMMGRVGTILAPITPAFGAQWFEELPFVLFGSMALLSGLLIFLTPETLGTKLSDTLQEANDLGRKKTKNQMNSEEINNNQNEI